MSKTSRTHRNNDVSFTGAFGLWPKSLYELSKLVKEKGPVKNCSPNRYHKPNKVPWYKLLTNDQVTNVLELYDKKHLRPEEIAEKTGIELQLVLDLVGETGTKKKRYDKQTITTETVITAVEEGSKMEDIQADNQTRLPTGV